MSKTIRQIAEEIGVSKQAVQKRISRDPLYTSIHPYIDMVGGTKYIASIGETLIKQAFLESEKSLSIDNDIDKTENHVDSESIPIADGQKELYNILKLELEAKNKQIETLQAEIAEERKHSREQADKISILADQAQKLQLAQMNPKELLSIVDPQDVEDSPKKTTFFSRLFRKEK